MVVGSTPHRGAYLVFLGLSLSLLEDLEDLSGAMLAEPLEPRIEVGLRHLAFFGSKGPLSLDAIESLFAAR